MFQSLPPAEVHAIARDYFQTCLNQALEWSLDLPRDGSDLEYEVELLNADVSATRDALKQKKFSPAMVKKADELLVGHLPPGRKADGDTRTMMREAVTRANVEQLRFLVASLTGDYEGTAIKDPIFAGMKPTGVIQSESQQDGTAPPTLAEACQTFVAVHIKADAWVAKTRNDYQRVLELTQAIIGPAKKVALLSAQDVKAMRDGLANLPKNGAKFSRNAGRSLVDLIRDENAGEPISGRTQDKYFTMFRGFLLWAVNEELLPKMPGAAIKIMRSKHEDDVPRLPYARDQLKTIFSSPIFTGCKSDARRTTAGSLILRDSAFWMPLVALYSGMRMCGIVFEDVSLADPDCVRLVMAATSGKTFRQQYGGDHRVAGLVVTRMCEARKCRATDDLFIAVSHHHELEAVRADLAGHDLPQHLSHVRERGALLGASLAALHASGVRWTGQVAGRRADAAATFAAMRSGGIDPEIVALAEQGFRRTREALPVLLPMLSSVLPTGDLPTLDDEFPPVVIGHRSGLPTYVYDAFSWEGKSALSRFLKRNTTTGRWLRRYVPAERRMAVLAGGLFRIEGGLVRQRVEWPCAITLRWLADSGYHNMKLSDPAEFLAMIRNDLPKLDEVRHDL